MITRKQFKTVLTALIVLYAVIFIARFIYDLQTFEDPEISPNYYFQSYEDKTKSSNVASFKMEYDREFGGTEILEQKYVLEQKYEQIANITTKTISYDSDLAELDGAIEQAQAVIQTERVQGLEGKRTISRAIGVKPQYFDNCLAAVKEIGLLISSTSQKTDKTYEYRQMLAEKQELEKRLESYMSLRGRSGSINEMLSLEDKIIEVESQLLQQAVDLGEYSDDNALCTINVTMYEGNPAGASRIIWNSLKWATSCYFSILAGFLFICLAAFVLVKTYIFLINAVTSENKKKTADNE